MIKSKRGDKMSIFGKLYRHRIILNLIVFCLSVFILTAAVSAYADISDTWTFYDVGPGAEREINYSGSGWVS